MRDGQGNKLSADDEAKVKSLEVSPDKGSLNQVSVDPKPATIPTDEMGKQPEPPEAATAPKF